MFFIYPFRIKYGAPHCKKAKCVFLNEYLFLWLNQVIQGVVLAIVSAQILKQQFCHQYCWVKSKGEYDQMSREPKEKAYSSTFERQTVFQCWKCPEIFQNWWKHLDDEKVKTGFKVWLINCLLQLRWWWSRWLWWRLVI